MVKRMTEEQLRSQVYKMVKESLDEGFASKDYSVIKEIRHNVLKCYDLAKSIEHKGLMDAFQKIWDIIEKVKFDK